jgi:hypothetical protein
MFRRFKDLFIPHEGNNFRPDILERVSVGMMLILILLSFAMANLQALLWVSSDWLVSTILPAVIVDLTNDERDTGDLTLLRRNATLDAAAKLKAEDMAKNEYFAHYSPTGVSPWYWFDQAGYDYLQAGENLAVHFTESNEVVEAWMNSPSHRANIMNGQYVEIGVGTAKGEYKGSPTIFVVQLFGAPRAASVAGANTKTPSNEITVEKVAIAPTQTDVAPATVAVEETTPVIPTPEPEPSEVTEDVSSDAIEIPVAVSSADEVDESVVYTSLATTSREGEPAIVPATTYQTPPNPVSIPARAATESSLWLQTLYAVLAFFVIAALVTSLAIEWRRHHPIQIAYAGGLLAVMGLLLYVHEALTGIVLIV